MRKSEPINLLGETMREAFDRACKQRDEARRIADNLLMAPKCFVNDERFVVSVGGNPIVVEKMIEDARAVIAKAEGSSK